jgi:hypothetical protein
VRDVERGKEPPGRTRYLSEAERKRLRAELGVSGDADGDIARALGALNERRHLCCGIGKQSATSNSAECSSDIRD